MTQAEAIERLRRAFVDLATALSVHYPHTGASVPVVVRGESYRLEWDCRQLILIGPGDYPGKTALGVLTAEALVCASHATPDLLAALEAGDSDLQLRLAGAEHALLETLKRVRASTMTPKEPPK